jgi:two-component system, chemotaxis family, chemotaxis protein CheY
MAEQAQKPAMIITDVNMPRMDGLTFVREVKKTSFKFVPILVLTTESQADKKAEGKLAGASGWLVKPFSPEQVLEVVRKFVR